MAAVIGGGWSCNIYNPEQRADSKWSYATKPFVEAPASSSKASLKLQHPLTRSHQPGTNYSNTRAYGKHFYIQTNSLFFGKEAIVILSMAYLL